MGCVRKVSAKRVVAKFDGGYVHYFVHDCPSRIGLALIISVLQSFEIWLRSDQLTYYTFLCWDAIVMK